MWQDKHQDSGSLRTCAASIGAFLVTSLIAANLATGGMSSGAGSASSAGKGEIRGEIIPVDQTRTLSVYAWDDIDCGLSEQDAAEGFEDYDNTIEVHCGSGKGRASQQSSIGATSLSAFGYAYAASGWHDGGGAESVFEVVFDSSHTQWCTLSGQISTEYEDEFWAGGTAEVRLTGPDGVMFEHTLSWEQAVFEFSEEFLLIEGERYTLRTAVDADADGGGDAQNEYDVLLELAGEVPANDVGVLTVNHPPSHVPAGECVINATIANFGTEDQEVPVHCEVMGPDITFLDEGFDGPFPPLGWSQEQDDEWQLHEGNRAGGAAPEAYLDRDNIIGDYAYLDSAPVDTTGVAHLMLEFKHHINVSHDGVVARVLTRSSAFDDWTDVTPWLVPLPDESIDAERVRLDITHDVGPATQVRFEYDSDDWRLEQWYLNDVRIYGLSAVYTADAEVSVSAIDTADVEFDPPWNATEDFHVLEATTELPGDEHPENDGQTVMLTVGPVTQYEEQKLLASDGEEHDEFGWSVAVDGDVAIVGAYGDDTMGSRSGAAYVYRFDGSAWIEKQKLLASDGSEYAYFGYAVSINGDMAFISAENESNENGEDAGSAYVFRLDGTSWQEETKLIASDGMEDDAFGRSVVVVGDVAIIGAPNTSDNGDWSGSAYIFRNDGSNWIEEAKLLASDGAAEDYFGASVALSNDTAVIGAWGDDDLGTYSGSAYIFRYDGSTWIEEAKLTASDGAAGDYFGCHGSVAIDGDRIVVGSQRDDDLGYDCGSAYVFRCEDAMWIEEAKLAASDAWVRDRFGSSVAICGGSIVVGSPGNWFESYGGSAYLFTRQDTDWVQTSRLMASDVEEGDSFGKAVAADGDVILVGSPCDNDDTGAAYIFAGPIAGDIDGDGDVDVFDLLALLAAWGPCEDCPEDIDGNGVVNTADLLILLGNWG